MYNVSINLPKDLSLCVDFFISVGIFLIFENIVESLEYEKNAILRFAIEVTGLHCGITRDKIDSIIGIAKNLFI